eukprot:SAG31_NODE_2645_length_5313_cov_6.731300_4_plen_217_part_00
MSAANSRRRVCTVRSTRSSSSAARVAGLVNHLASGAQTAAALRGGDSEAAHEPPLPPPPPLVADMAAAAATIQLYFDASHGKDPEALRPYWQATLKGVGPDGTLMMRSPEAFMDMLCAPGREPCTDPAITGMDAILSIEQSSPVTIFAKVQVAAPSYAGNGGAPVVFTDFLSLLKLDGKWVVGSKAFSWAPLAAPFGGFGYEETSPVREFALALFN